MLIRKGKPGGCRLDDRHRNNAFPRTPPSIKWLLFSSEEKVLITMLHNIIVRPCDINYLGAVTTYTDLYSRYFSNDNNVIIIMLLLQFGIKMPYLHSKHKHTLHTLAVRYKQCNANLTVKTNVRISFKHFHWYDVIIMLIFLTSFYWIFLVCFPLTEGVTLKRNRFSEILDI